MVGENEDFFFKIILLGAKSVGKTSILMRSMEEHFPESTRATVGVDFRTRMFDHPQGSVKLQIWDTAGTESLRSLARTYYKDIHACILMYDISKKESFNNIHYWMEELQTHGNQYEKKLIIGNKLDLEESREVTTYEGTKFAVQNYCEFCECSAKTGSQVNEMLRMLIDQMIEEFQMSSDFRAIGKASTIDIALANTYVGGSQVMNRNPRLKKVKKGGGKGKKPGGGCCGGKGDKEEGDI